MRCEGVPIDGTVMCPQNVCDDTVKHCQGDLFLCPACEEIRFPTVPLPSSKSSKSNKDKPSKPSTRQTRVSQTSVDDKISCSICSNNCFGRWLKCSMCVNVYDQRCSNLSPRVFDTIYPLADEFGWVCLDCRSSCNKTIEQLQSAVASINEQMADIVEKVALCECKCRCSVSPQPAPLKPDAKAAPSDIDVSIEVHRTLADKDKRKCNVVITGLPEEISSAHDASIVSGSTTADEIAFLKLCEENLSTKPILSHLGCRRLGKPRQDDRRPRKLLVHLTSESSVSALLSEAKKLRHSDDSVVASNVYINPDLSPAELQLAFERRQARRTRRVSNQDRDRLHTDTQSEVSFPTVQPYTVVNSFRKK